MRTIRDGPNEDQHRRSLPSHRGSQPHRPAMPEDEVPVLPLDGTLHARNTRTAGVPRSRRAGGRSVLPVRWRVLGRDRRGMDGGRWGRAVGWMLVLISLLEVFQREGIENRDLQGHSS